MGFPLKFTQLLIHRCHNIDRSPCTLHWLFLAGNGNNRETPLNSRGVYGGSLLKGIVWETQTAMETFISCLLRHFVKYHIRYLLVTLNYNLLFSHSGLNSLYFKINCPQKPFVRILSHPGSDIRPVPWFRICIPVICITDGILVPFRELNVNLEAIITQKDCI